MKVIAINGSPHPQGNTFHALKNIGEELKKENIEFEILQVREPEYSRVYGMQHVFPEQKREMRNHNRLIQRTTTKDQRR